MGAGSHLELSARGVRGGALVFALLNIVGLQITASPFPKACAALAISMLIAWAIHQVVEKPCAVLRKKLSAAASGRAGAPWRPGHAVTT